MTSFKMVRVLKCHNFKEQKVFSDAYEPTSIACSVSKDLVFVASSDSQVFVYSLVDDGFPQVCHFPLVSPSKELIFSDIGNYVLSKETTRKDKPGHYTARVYFNWSKPLEGEGKSSHKIKVYQIGYSVTRSYTSKPETLTAVEILSRFSVHALTRCPSTGSIAVATETAVTIYKRFVDYPFDLQRVYVVEPGFSIHKLAICEHFVAFASTTEVRVLRVTFNGQTALSYERSWSKDE